MVESYGDPTPRISPEELDEDRPVLIDPGRYPATMVFLRATGIVHLGVDPQLPVTNSQAIRL